MNFLNIRVSELAKKVGNYVDETTEGNDTIVAVCEYKGQYTVVTDPRITCFDDCVWVLAQKHGPDTVFKTYQEAVEHILETLGGVGREFFRVITGRCFNGHLHAYNNIMYVSLKAVYVVKTDAVKIDH